eukprot:230109_1
MLTEQHYEKRGLDVHFDESFPDESCTEKRPKRKEKMTACDSAQIESHVWPGRKRQNGPEPVPMQQVEHPRLGAIYEIPTGNAFLEFLEFFVDLAGRGSSSTDCIRRYLPDGRASAPHKTGKEHLFENTEKSDRHR